MATYDLSTFGKTIVVNEGYDEVPTIRIIFVLTTILFGLCFKFNEALVFWSLWLDRRVANRPRILNLLYLAYTVNSIIYIVKCVDSIVRPVTYYEPKILYQKYVLSTMELPFFINFPIILIGYYGLTRLLVSLAKGQVELIWRNSRLLLCYSILSLLSLLHYRQEPISSYSVWINFIIISEAFTAFILTAILAFISYLNYKKQFTNTNTDSIKFIHINKNFLNYSEDEDVETFNKQKVQRATRQRSRSKTPTGLTEL